jgi:hypothetical protein
MPASLRPFDLPGLFARISTHLLDQSHRLAVWLDLKMELLLRRWLVVTLILGGLKLLSLVALNPQAAPPAQLPRLILPFLLVAIAPVAGYRIAAACFPKGRILAQPAVRLARIGQWQNVSAYNTASAPAARPGGIVVSLIAGLLIAIVLRTGEYFLAVPVVPAMAPEWAHAIALMMTMDMVLMNFMYAVCFVMGLRAVPHFPRMMALTWAFDLLMQLAIARTVAAAPALPGDVAVAIQSLLTGNLQKVLISVTIWLPYLLVSNRVNLTFRRRVRVGYAV